MSRVLAESEVGIITLAIAAAASEARLSPCAKVQRGVVVFHRNDNGIEIITRGKNSPPKPYFCIPPLCLSQCNDMCIHAEEDAGLNALENGKVIQGMSMLQVRLSEGLIVPSRKPSCARCSAFILRIGISEFILYHQEGFTSYSAVEYHQVSLDNIRTGSR